MLKSSNVSTSLALSNPVREHNNAAVAAESFMSLFLGPTKDSRDITELVL